LDAKQNYNHNHRPLWREWVGRCPLTKSTKNDKFNMTRPFHWPTTIYRHPSTKWTSG
jgi:hypothetical protein